MSYYFAIVGTQDNPLFEHEFGTSKQGGDGQSRFTDQVRHLNQFILHSSLDIAEEVQWSHGQMFVLQLPLPTTCCAFELTDWAFAFLQVSQVHRQVLRQLHLLLRHRRQRQVPPPPSPYHADRYKLVAILDGHRRESNKSGDRGGRQDVLFGGVRELGQGHYESILPTQYGATESSV